MTSLFNTFLSDLSSIKDSSNPTFGFKERMKLERTLFIILNILVKEFLSFTLLGFSEQHKDEILEKIKEQGGNKNLETLISKIFDLKFTLQALSNESAYVRGDTLSKLDVNRKSVFKLIEVNIISIKQAIINTSKSDEFKEN
jgi:hypothetical protein